MFGIPPLWFILSIVIQIADAQFRPFSPRNNWFSRNGLPSPIPGPMIRPNQFPRRVPFRGGIFPPMGFPGPFAQSGFPAPQTPRLGNPAGFPVPFDTTLPIGATSGVQPFPTPPSNQITSNFQAPFSPVSQLPGIAVPTAVPWTPNTATQPVVDAQGPQFTVPSGTSPSITFTPISDAYQSVSISATDSDSMYTRIKDIFDAAYPQLPPLRRTDVRVLFQIQRSPNLDEATAVLSDDLSTLYVPYRIPNHNAIGYIPFDRRTKELTYPDKPIFLPYPQLSVRIADQDFPVYLPFQPDGSRSADAIPEVFIPFQNPPVPVPDYIVFLPFVPEVSLKYKICKSCPHLHWYTLIHVLHP